MTAEESRLKGFAGLGPKRLKVLADAGIHTVSDLLYTYPVRYKNTLQPLPVCQLQAGKAACIQCVLKDQPRLSRFKGRTLVTAVMTDGTGVIRLNYWNQPWMRDRFSMDVEYLLYGQVGDRNGQTVMLSPSIEKERALIPVYKALPGIPPATFSQLIGQALELIDECVRETLPEATRARNGLCDIGFALRALHRPADPEELMTAEKRLTFESLLMYQAAMGLAAGRRDTGVKMDIDPSAVERYWTSLPFPPTGAQKRVLAEIADDMASPRPMSRLVQGDVGCGKTAIAFGAAYLAFLSGWQAAVMAPTEILARQHYESAKAILSPLGARVGLLLGGMKQAEHRQVLMGLETGETDIVIGTHALISRDVVYDRLGLIVTDEQHRFGVRQRKALSDKASVAPNVLVMSATPIPRSLALVLYGDLDLSVVDELPPGRTPVKTRIVPENKRDGLYDFIRREAALGHQTYIVCPLVEETEALDAPSAEEVYAELCNGPLRDLKIGLTYGSQKGEEKDRILTAFSKGELDVLVATTVIEVGVNVPSATVMVIESADRFGLSQLHQLRGRVGRGAGVSWCFLMAKENERLSALVRSNDGFEIASEDLKERGPGDLLGTRQHGLVPLPGQKQAFDVRTIDDTRRELDLLRTPGHEQELMLLTEAARERYSDILADVAMN